MTDHGPTSFEAELLDQFNSAKKDNYTLLAAMSSRQQWEFVTAVMSQYLTKQPYALVAALEAAMGKNGLAIALDHFEKGN